MTKKKYQSIACAIAFAASVAPIVSGTVYAAPEEEETEVAAVEETVTEPVQPVEAKRMPTPEEVDAMLAGQSPEMVKAISEEMKAKAERKGQQVVEGNTEVSSSEEAVPTVTTAPVKPELPSINDADLPVEMRTVKPEGYDPAAPKQVVAEQPTLEKTEENSEEEIDEEAEQIAEQAAEKPAESVVAASTVQPQPEVKPVVPAPQEEPVAPKPETEKEKKARLKAEKKAQKEKERQERKAKKEQEKAAKKAAKSGENKVAEQAEPAKAAEKQADSAAQVQPAVTSAGNSEKAVQSWTMGRPSEQIIIDTMNKLNGRTIVDVNIVGAGASTIDAAKKAVITRGGDYFSQMIIDKDREALFETGYFYDLYPTFQIVPEGIIVTYNLLENPVLTEVEISGNTVYTTDELRKLITVKPGEILNAKMLHENLQAVEQKYQDDGYVLVKLSGIDVGRDGKLKLGINEGVLEGYTVKGNTKTKDRVIIREMRQKKGEPFNAKKARRGMQRVYNLGYFEDVNMKLNPGVEPNAVVLEVDVVEKRTGSFTVGAGYSTRDGFLGMVGFGDKNFRGIGDSFHFSYEFGGDDWDAQGFQFTYRRPWLDRHETALGLKLYNRRYEYDDYDTNGDNIEDYMRKQVGIDLTFSRPQTEYTTNFLLLRDRKDEYIRHKDGWCDRSTPLFADWRDDNYGRTRSITFDHVTDTRDNVYNPTEGGRTDLTLEYAGLGGKFKYEKVTYEQSHFTKVGHAQVFAWRWSYGRGFGHIPEAGQYRLGGQDTIRGYRDDCFRGNSMYLASIEYRFPIVRKVQGAIFADAGAAWYGGWNPHGSKGSIGVGVSLDTPVGPIRLDLGHGSQGNRVHFSMGGAF